MVVPKGTTSRTQHKTDVFELCLTETFISIYIHPLIMAVLKVGRYLLISLIITALSTTCCAGTSDDQQYLWEQRAIHQFAISGVSPYEFYPGDLKTINITVKNIRKNTVFDVSTNITTPGSVKVKKELMKQRPGALYPDGTCTFQYELYIGEDSPKGVYYLPVTVMWYVVEGGAVLIQEDLKFGIEVVESPEDVKIDIVDIISPAHIKAGDNFTIKIGLKNVGEVKAGSIRADLPLYLPFASIGSDTEIFIPPLNPAETANMEYELQVDKQAVSKLYNFNFTLQYRDQNNRLISKNSGFGINLEEAPPLYIQDIIIEPTVLGPGTGGLFMIQLVNAGTNPVENIKVMVYGGDEILSQTHNFIGQIDPSASETTSFGVYVDPEAKTGKYGLDIRVTYETIGGGTHTLSNMYLITVTPPSSLISIPDDAVFIVEVTAGLLLLSYIIFCIIGSRIARSKERDR